MIRLPRLTLARSMVAIALAGLLLAAGRSALMDWPEAGRRRNLATMHSLEAATWRSAASAIQTRGDLGGRPPLYRRFASQPTALLRNPRRYDATGRPVEYRYGSHFWLGPDDPTRAERMIRDDLVALCLDLADHHDRMRRKWSIEALRPWRQADPDPPKPPLIYDPPGDSY